MARRTQVTALAAAGAAGWWTWRHARAPMVRGWSPPDGERCRAADLAVRTLGDGDDIVLLHGLTASGDAFGAGFDRLADDSRLVVPDLLGFGISMDMRESDFGLGAQLDALDAMARELRLDGDRWTVGGHSMGGILAVHWAARHADRVARVVTWGAPLHSDREAAIAAIRRMGLLESLFVLETPYARAVCRWMCDHRWLAGWLAAALNPDTPVTLARQGVQHTWESYRDALKELVLEQDWRPALDALIRADTSIVLTYGRKDPVVDQRLLRDLARRKFVTVIEHPDAGHELPIAHPDWCANQLTT